MKSLYLCPDRSVKAHVKRSILLAAVILIHFSSFSQDNELVGKPLPLSLTDFTARLNNKKVVISWSTDMELHSSHFIIQRSMDGESYEDAGIVFTDAEGNAHRDYQYIDPIPSWSGSLLYYRLKMVDLDAKFRYSEVLVVRLAPEQETGGLVLFPNPVSHDLRVSIPAKWQNQRISYHIYNCNAVLIKQRISSNAGQTETLEVADLPPGMYIVKTENGKQEAVGKFIKMN